MLASCSRTFRPRKRGVARLVPATKSRSTLQLGTFRRRESRRTTAVALAVARDALIGACVGRGASWLGFPSLRTGDVTSFVPRKPSPAIRSMDARGAFISAAFDRISVSGLLGLA